MSRAITIFAVLLLIAGCSDVVDEPAGFLAAVPTTECAHLTRCGLFDTVDHCLAIREQRPDLDDQWPWWPRRFPTGVIDAIDRGTVIYDADAAARCLAALRERSCSRAGKDGAGVCGAVFVGTIATGDVASYAYECESGWQDQTSCDALSECCVAPCVSPPLVGERGQSCRGEFGRCNEGLGCREGTCGDPFGFGERCVVSSECAGDLICGPDHTCAPVGSFGDDCVFNRFSPGARCEDVGKDCHGDDRGFRCQPVARAGAPCDDNYTYCGFGLVCDRERGRCRDLAREGETCIVDRGASCERGLTCAPVGDDYVCRDSIPEGEPCMTDSGCTTGYCAPFTKVCADAPSCSQ